VDMVVAEQAPQEPKMLQVDSPQEAQVELV
jgi:hypothetical protein